MAFFKMQNVALRPVEVGFFRANAEAFCADAVAKLVEKFLGFHGIATKVYMTALTFEIANFELACGGTR